MIEGILKGLLSDDLLLLAGTISRAPALHQFFAAREEVRQVAVALNSGAVTEDSVRRFTENLLQELRPGVLFRHDLTLAALAVALETWLVSFAEEYLSQLAGLKTAGMPYAPRVAREVLGRLGNQPGFESDGNRCQGPFFDVDAALELTTHPAEQEYGRFTS